MGKALENRDKKAFEQFKKDIETKSNHDRKILEQGSQEELLARNGAYSKLEKAQGIE